MTKIDVLNSALLNSDSESGAQSTGGQLSISSYYNTMHMFDLDLNIGMQKSVML